MSDQRTTNSILANDEQLVDLTVAAQEVFKGSFQARTCLRWPRRGLLSCIGERIRLETVKGPGRKILTSIEAMRRFQRALNQRPTTPVAARVELADDETFLAELGLGREVTP